MLARELVGRGHAVRGTTREQSRVPEIEAAGAEAVVADPDRVATLVGSLDHVTVVCVLLGSAVGSAEQVAALHGTRLEMLLTKVVDTTARGVVYEAAGTVDPVILQGGVERVERFAARSLAAVSLIDADPADHDRWLCAGLDAVGRIL
jgi:hypothetical protein